MLLHGHRFAVVTETIEQAVFFFYYAQGNAEVQSGAMILEHAFSGDGGAEVRYLIAQDGTDACAANRPLIFRPWKLWHREVQTLGTGLYINDL